MRSGGRRRPPPPASAAAELRHPERRVAIAGEAARLDQVDRLDGPLGAKEVVAMLGRVQPAVERGARRARAALGDVEVLAPAAEVAHLVGYVERLGAARRVVEPPAADDRGALQLSRFGENGRDEER